MMERSNEQFFSLPAKSKPGVNPLLLAPAANLADPRCGREQDAESGLVQICEQALDEDAGRRDVPASLGNNLLQ